MEDYKAQYYNEALQHYGVKGMKWGVRRKRATKAVKKQKMAKKAIRKARAKRVAAAVNKASKTANKTIKKSVKTYGNFQKERSKAFGNAFVHPIMSKRALSNNMKNDKLRTKLRKQLYITGKEYESINRDVKRQKAARRRKKQK